MSDSSFHAGRYWWLGVILAIVGNFIDACGWIIEKRSHINIQHHAPDKKESISYLCNCQWWCGFITHVSGAAIFSIALGIGDQALLMPLNSTVLVFNTIFARIFLKELLTKLQILGTILVIIGCALAVAFGPKTDNSQFNAVELSAMFRNPAFLAFGLLITVVIVVDFFLFKCKVLINNTFLMLSYISIAGFFGSWNVLFTKCFIEIVITSSYDKQTAKLNWTHWLSYISFFLIVITTILLEYWRQEALKGYPANYVGSIYTGIVIVGGICFGAFFFDEFIEMSIRDLIIFVFSVCVVIGGIGLLTFCGYDSDKGTYMKSKTDINDDTDVDNYDTDKSENDIQMTVTTNGEVK
eukprot:526661_1